MHLISNNTGNWEIYRTIDEETSEAFIVRFPRSNFGTKIDSYLANYKTIQKLGIPTLNLVERYEIDNKVAIRTEDLNYMQDRLYITYNSLYSDSRKMVDMLSQNIIKRNTEKKSPEYEEFRYSNKLREITNLEQFIADTTKDLRSVSRQGVLIDFDSYFFGTEKASDVSAIDYKIVDMDNITIGTIKEEHKLYAKNISEFKMALHGFIKYFVEAENQSSHLKCLEKL